MKQLEKSIRAKLYNISKRENINFQHLIIRYLHERLLYRISISSYRTKFYLKGGTLLYAYSQNEKPRYTLDIDFSLNQMEYEQQKVVSALKEICAIYDNDGVLFENQTIVANYIRENDIYGGLRVLIQAKLDTILQRLQVDIGYGDEIYPKPVEISFPVMLNNLATPVIYAYSLETVIAEKFHAMIELSVFNSRMKDFFDVYQLLNTEQYNDKILKQAVSTTFQNRETFFSENHALFTDEFANDTQRNRDWLSFLKKINRDASLQFPQVMTQITHVLKPIWEMLPIE
jgi:predicted nucleotidyltransferase component of viral defense system